MPCLNIWNTGSKNIFYPSHIIGSLIQRFEIITFLRGYSIFTIVVFHLLQALKLDEPWNALIQFGGTGVHLFFLLSGFGLFYSYLNRQPKPATFYRHKFSRIYLPYIIVVLISALIALFWPVFEGSWYALGGHIFLYKMFDERIIGSYGYQLWFMSTLFQFYLVFYILVALEKYLSKAWFLSFSVFISLTWAMLVWWLGKEDLRIWNSFFLHYIWEFVLGMVMAGWLQEGKMKQNFKSGHFLLTGVIFCVSYAWMGMKGGASGQLFNDYFALLGYSSIAIFLYKVLPKSFVKGMVWMGGFSFALYLWHMLILEIVKYTQGNEVQLYQMALVLIISVMVSYFYNKWFTRIIQKYRI